MASRTAVFLLFLALPGFYIAACTSGDDSSGTTTTNPDSGSTTGDGGGSSSDGSKSDAATGKDSGGSDGSTSSTACLTAANGTFSGATSVGGDGLYASGYTIFYGGIVAGNTGSFSINCALDDAGLVAALPCTIGTPVMHDFTADHKTMTLSLTSLDGGTAVVSGAVGDD